MTESVILSPKSIAVIGASDKEGSVGRAITSNIMKGYTGTVFLLVQLGIQYSIKRHTRAS